MHNKRMHSDSASPLMQGVRGRAELKTRILLLVLFSTVVFGCSEPNSNSRTDYKISVKSSDIEYMEALMAFLEKKAMPYVYTAGEIRVKKEASEDFKEAESHFSKKETIFFPDELVRKEFLRILEAEGVEYFEFEKNGEAWTAWWPESDEVFQTLSTRAIDYWFENIAKKGCSKRLVLNAPNKRLNEHALKRGC